MYMYMYRHETSYTDRAIVAVQLDIFIRSFEAKVNFYRIVFCGAFCMKHTLCDASLAVYRLIFRLLACLTS